MENIVDRIRILCQENGTSITKIEKELGYANGTIGKWRTSKRKPPLEKVLAIAKRLQTTTEYLYDGNEKAPTQAGERKISEDDIKLALFGGDGEVTDEMWDEAQFAIQLIKERYKRKKDANE